jgi:Fic family protein
MAESHAAFEMIHPFSDGNGRTGRLLILAQALHAGIAPPIIPKERKQAYYKYLELAQVHENVSPLEMFIAESVINSKEILIPKDTN